MNVNNTTRTFPRTMFGASGAFHHSPEYAGCVMGPYGLSIWSRLVRALCFWR